MHSIAEGSIPSSSVVCRLAAGLMFFAIVTETSYGQPPFTEEAVERGIDYVVTHGGWLTGFGAGVVFTDLDGDGDPDIVVSGRDTSEFGVYENDGTGHFVDRSATCGIPPMPTSSGIVAGDYDGDGDLDLYITDWNGPNKLFRNLGAFVFEDVTEAAGVGDPGHGYGAVFGDYDGDGWLDLYLPNRNGGIDYPNEMFHNLGNGSFEAVGAVLGVDDGGASFQAVFFDYDLDGDVDLYLANDKGTPEFPNRLWKNVGGTFIDVSAESGTDAIGDLMGVAVGDFDRNGFPDLYVTNIPVGNVLLLNQGDGTFVEAQEKAGVGVFASGWGTLFFDYDNDGDEDLYVVNSIAPNVLFRYDGFFPVIDVAEEMGLAEDGSSFCTAVADVDNDGDLDILLQTGLVRIQLLINHASDAGGDSNNWLKVRLVGVGPNKHAVGARVDIQSGGEAQSRQVFSGIGFKSSSTLVQHFGLGDAALAESVVVHWPSGVESVLHNVPANQTLVVDEACAQYGDFDCDGATTLSDYALLQACLSGPGVKTTPEGCDELVVLSADVDGDGDLDLKDVAAFLVVLDSR